MPKVPSCLMLRNRQNELSITLANNTLRRHYVARIDSRTRAVSFDESRASYIVIEVPEDLRPDQPVEEINCSARWSRASSSFASSRSSLLRSRSRGQSTNLSLLASTDAIDENSACRDQQGQECPPSPSASGYDGTWGQFIDFVPPEDETNSVMYNKYVSTSFSKSQSRASSGQTSHAHPYMSAWSNGKRTYTSRHAGTCGMESRRVALNNNQEADKKSSALVSPTLGCWTLLNENEPHLFSLDSGSYASPSTVDLAEGDTLLEQKLQEMQVWFNVLNLISIWAMLFAYCFGVMQRDLNDRGWGQITVSAWWYKASIISCLTAISIDDVTATKIKRAYTAVNRLSVWFPRRSYESVLMNLENDNTGSGNNFYQISVNVCNVFFAWYRCLQRYCTTATYMDRQRIKYVSWHLARAVAGVKTTRDVLKLRFTRI